jgi:hypothetical protein
LVDQNPYLSQIDNFSRAIRSVAEPLLGRAETLAQAAVLDALLRSAAAEGEWTRPDVPRGERFA